MARLTSAELALTYWYEIVQLTETDESLLRPDQKKRLDYCRKVIRRETLKALVKQSNGKCCICGGDANTCYERHMRGRSCG